MDSIFLKIFQRNRSVTTIIFEKNKTTSDSYSIFLRLFNKSCFGLHIFEIISKIPDLDFQMYDLLYDFDKFESPQPVNLVKRSYLGPQSVSKSESLTQCFLVYLQRLLYTQRGWKIDKLICFSTASEESYKRDAPFSRASF